MNNKKCKIFVSYHKPAELLESSVFTPIHVGRSVAFSVSKDGVLSSDKVNWLKANLIGDDTGENISSKNPYYCELTAQYWAWKNCDADYVGFMHYRRHLSFNDKKKYKENIYGLVSSPILNKSYIERFKLDSKHIEKLVSRYDIVTVHPWDVTQAGSKNNYDHYENSDKKLHIKDYDEALKIIKDKYPDFTQDIKMYNKSKIGYYTNIFVMKRELFDKYCAWLFDILEELEKRTNISSYSPEEARVFGYVSEWLFGIYMFHLKRVGSYKIKELQRTFILNGNINQNPDNINICFAVDNNYAQHLGAAIASILKNTKTSKGIDIYIIADNSLKSKNKKRLLQLKDLRGNTNITILNLNDDIFNEFPVPMHFTKAIYYRFIIPSLFENLDKIIYLDCDLIVKGDIEELYNIELGNNYIAAVQDIIGYENQVRLHLNTKREYYCNSGVLVMNLVKIRQKNIEERLINSVKRNKGRLCWPDQDIINIEFEGKIKYLDLSWNLQYYTKNDPYDYSEEVLQKAKNNPNIIHYIGASKPWDLKIKRLYGNEYFKYLMFTPWKYMIVQYSLKKIIFEFKNIFNFIFSMRNEASHKRITIFGMRFKIKCRNLENRAAIRYLSERIDGDLYRELNDSRKMTQKLQQDLLQQKVKISNMQKRIESLSQQIGALCK